MPVSTQTAHHLLPPPAGSAHRIKSQLAKADLRRILILSILIGIILSACSDTEGQVSISSTAEERAIPVRLATVQLRQDEELLRFAGVSRVRQRALLTFQVSGVIQSRNTEIGETVSAGQTLMTLYSPALQPSFDAARHRLAQLEADQLQAIKERDRLQTLYERGVIPLQELEQQSTRVSSLMSAVSNAEATLEQAGSLLREAALLAPFDGTVEQILLEPGEFAQAGQPAVRISSSSQLETEIRVPVHLTEGLHVGQQLPVWSSLAALGSARTPPGATITEIGQSSTGDSALYPVVLALNEHYQRTGEALEIGVPRRNQSALVIPMAAVMRSADGLTVFRSNRNRVQRVAVEIEQLQGELAVIKSGSLEEGAQIVYAGITRLADGDLIEVLP
ncbi:MAG: efflux RND transporter periplasmic adaptor subunit [Pseudohongiella sp.]|nr:efflux RND transporter periplasmic adaptor subunit [Pseudohongiella sp.]